MNEIKQAYFIALFPEESVCAAITVIKNDFARRFASRSALRIGPHITLLAPFYLTDTEAEKLFSWFDNLSLIVSPFRQELKDFGAFRKRKTPVVYIRALPNPSLLALQEQLHREFRLSFPEQPLTEPERAFTPHITVAYRDLRAENFREAWREYAGKKFEASFDVTAITLLRHDGKEWKKIREHSLEEFR